MKFYNPNTLQTKICNSKTLQNAAIYFPKKLQSQYIAKKFVILTYYKSKFAIPIYCKML